MKQQYKAAFLHRKVFEELKELHKDAAFHFKVLGLLESVSTFNCNTSVNLKEPELVQPLLAVANNLITRGAPTWCSSKVKNEVDNLIGDFTSKDFFEALHLVDTSVKEGDIYKDDLDSKFEEAFLENYIKEDNQFLIQFFKHQRGLDTLTNDQTDTRRADFCFEAPYYIKSEKQDVYHNLHSLKSRSALIIEIDGKKYHNNFIDNLRDFATIRFGANVKRIREDTADKDTDDLIERLLRSDYFKVVEKLRTRDRNELERLQNLVLSPIAMARIQKVINQYLVSNYNVLRQNNQESLSIAILERDVVCGKLAVDDLNDLYANLVGLENKQAFIPIITCEVFNDENSLLLAVENQTNQFDLVIDNSILWREGVFAADQAFQHVENSITLRSSHFTEECCINSILCAEPIKYRNLTIEINNEQHKDIPEALSFIEYFNLNIFGHPNFRRGQLPILNRALQNKTVIGLLPTGGGKSLTYQLAALLQPGITLVIDPIRSLMVDQYEGLLENGIDKCDFTNSILSRQQKQFIQDEILPKGKTQFLFISPERLVIQEFRDTLKLVNEQGYYFSYCVIDEAHCVSEWGHDFRTAYLNLGENAINYCSTFNKKDVPIFGLTATASFDVLSDIERELKISENDGKAIIRYENTVRDEINYSIEEITVVAEDPTGINDTVIATSKKNKAKEILQNLNSSEGVINVFNKQSVYTDILRKTYNDYLPEFEKNGEAEYIKKKTDEIIIKNDEDGLFRKTDNKFNYGAIVFCPHKTGGLGVLGYVSELNSETDRAVYFHGSGDMRANDVDRIVFDNLKLFKENEASVMVATKAFGMGIDKPNIRLTMHANISSSIESFVQESGRAGRDGKTSVSVALFNRITNKDKDVLLSFHKISFKGADKERSVIWELRNKIFYPVKTNLQDLELKLSEATGYKIKLNLYEGDFATILYVKDVNENEYGKIHLSNRGFYDFEDSILKSKIEIALLEKIPNFFELETPDIIKFLKQNNANSELAEGIEHIINNNNFDYNKSIAIPFTNKFYSKYIDKNQRRRIDDFKLGLHRDFLLDNSRFRKVVNQTNFSIHTLTERLKNAVSKDYSFEEFIDSLFPADSEVNSHLKNTKMLKVRFYIPREESDTAKAIYRLTSIGIVKDYTIDYNNKLYYIRLNDPTEIIYFNEFQKLLGRYTSGLEAKNLRQKCEEEYKIEFQEGRKVTEMSKCLEHLTNYIYAKIADKRKRAINDMYELCVRAIEIEDPVKQSEAVKEEIYYYFNAKYSRQNNTALGKNDEKISADLNQDFKEEIGIENTVWKYIEEIVEYDDGGQFINNIKHLRGATMRMLRVQPKAAQFNFLKAYSLFFLASITKNPKELKKEAIREMSFGLENWSEMELIGSSFEMFMQRFKDNLAKHIPIDETLFQEVNDIYYLRSNSKWLKEFSLKLKEE